MSFSCASGAVGSKKQPGLLGAPGFPPEKAHPVCLRCSTLDFIHTKELEWTWMLTFVWEVVSGIWLMFWCWLMLWFLHDFTTYSKVLWLFPEWRCEGTSNKHRILIINEWILLWSCYVFYIDHFRSPPQARCVEPFLATLIFKLLGRPRQYLANHGGH